MIFTGLNELAAFADFTPNEKRKLTEPFGRHYFANFT
jgi:hypothetical protein